MHICSTVRAAISIRVKRGTGNPPSVKSRGIQHVSVELAVWKATLRDKATAKVAVDGVEMLFQLHIMDAVLGFPLQFRNSIGRYIERADGALDLAHVQIRELGCCDVLLQHVQILRHLHAIVSHIKWDDVVSG